MPTATLVGDAVSRAGVRVHGASTNEQRGGAGADVLLAADGLASRAIGRELGCARGVVSKWWVRFAKDRLAGLADAPGAGKPRTYGEAADRRILARLDRPPPEGFARWTAPLIARDLGDVSDQYVWRSLRAQGIDLAGRKSWCLSTDPEFAAKAADIVGLYLDPPHHAIVLAVDEKPAIQALERAQGYLKLPNDRALTGVAHEDKRRGTTTLFAALEARPARSRPSTPGAGGAPSSSTS
jgi:transposase